MWCEVLFIFQLFIIKYTNPYDYIQWVRQYIPNWISIWLSILLWILIWYKYEIFVINMGNGKFALLIYWFQSSSVYFAIQSHWFGPYLKLFHLQKEQVINSSQILPKTLFILLAETQDIQDDVSESRKNNSPLKTNNRFPFFKKTYRALFPSMTKVYLQDFESYL